MELKEIAKNIMVSCLAVKPTEDVLIITDDSRLTIGTALYEGAKELGCEALLMVMKERELSGEEPPRTVAEAMKAADVVICPTAKSLTHTNAKIEAQKTGTRVATMPGITEEMFGAGAMTADYDEVLKLTGKVTELLTKAKKAVIQKDGCTLTLNLDGRDGVPSPGVYREAGQCGNLPSGEAYIAPLEDGVNGEMIVDGSMVGIGKLDAPLKFVIKDGKLQSITGEKSEMLDVLLANENNSTVAELGIGTNEAAILNGIILEDEKVYGTVHVAFGTNTSFGGVNKADCHMDGIILKPTLYLDDTLAVSYTHLTHFSYSPLYKCLFSADICMSFKILPQFFRNCKHFFAFFQPFYRLIRKEIRSLCRSFPKHFAKALRIGHIFALSGVDKRCQFSEDRSAIGVTQHPGQTSRRLNEA